MHLIGIAEKTFKALSQHNTFYDDIFCLVNTLKMLILRQSFDVSKSASCKMNLAF